MFPRVVKVFLDKQVGGMFKHKEIYVTPSHTKNVFANIKRHGKYFSGRVTPLFQTMMVQAQEDMGEGSRIPTDPYHIPNVTQPSTSYPPQKKQNPRKSKKKNTEVPQLSGSTNDLADENMTTTSNDPLLIGSSRRIESLNEASLGDQDDASKQRRNIADIDADAETLIEIKAAKPKAVTTAAKTTTIVVTRPKAKGVIVQEPSEFTTTTSPSQPSQLPQAKDKGKAKMVELEKPLKRKDQIMIDEEVARNLEAQLQAELEEEDRLARQKEEEANIVLIAEWDDVQAIMDADHELAKRLQAEELKAEEKMRKPPSKAQNRNQMCTYLKNMAGSLTIIKDKVEGSETRAEGSSKRAGEELESDKKQKEDLETLWELLKAKYGNTRPEEAYERVLWGDLKVLKFAYLYAGREKVSSYTATITEMLNGKLQADHWNEFVINFSSSC
nr:hypothetical protein [Tanacetum cinerariifolium]